MANEEDPVAALVAPETTEQDLEKPSPSQSLLQKLKSLREWQERQREELMQVLAHSMPHKGPFLSPLKEETPAQLSESVVTDHSTPLHSMPDWVEDSHTTVGLPMAGAVSSAIVITHHPPVLPHENFPEEMQLQSRQTKCWDQLPDSQSYSEVDHMAGVTRPTSHPSQTQHSNEWQAPSPPTVAGHPVVCDTSDPERSDLEGDERRMAGTPVPAGAPQRIEDSATLSPQDPSEYVDESMQDLFGIEKQKPYRSDKYKSPPPTKECPSKRTTTHAGEAVRNFGPTKSFFSTMSQQPEGGAAEETPRPRHRFLRKGQGTSRFGMKPMRLKNKSEKESAPESNLISDAAMQNNEELRLTTSPPVVTPTKRHFRLPMQTLKLQGVVQVSPPESERWSGKDGPVQLRASPATAPAQPSAQHRTTGPSGTRDLEKQQRKEEEELSAFEKLEELAEDSSFSSNSSTVWHLLKQGQQSASSTPLRTPPPLAFQETPVVGSLGMQFKHLGAESQFLVGDLTKQVVPATTVGPPSQQQVREVLAQLKSIVRLEGHSISDVSESDIQTLLERCSSQQMCGDEAHSTSTPLLPTPLPPLHTPPHHVHFASQGVQVMEYELSDSEGEDTLTEAASLDSDLMTTSDLEALTQMSVGRAPDAPHWQQQTKLSKASNSEADSTSSSEVPLSEQETPPGREPVVLTYSPPPPRPAQSASNYIWSIFGKERDARKQSAPKAPPKQVKKKDHQRPPPAPSKTTKSVGSAAHPDPDTEASQELEVHKTLLLAKVAELEKETNLFKKENSKLKRLQQQVQEERQKLEEEKRRLDEETATERRKFQEYVDRERNALWREKQQVLHRPVQVTQPQEQQVMEVVRLREQIRELREEGERKESLHQFAVKKFTDRIKTLENENKKLKERNKTLQALEKENEDLRLKADQARSGGRARAGSSARAASQPSKPTRGKPKPGARSTTVDGVAKALDRLTKPQPVIVKEPQGSSTSKASKVREDVANNNTNTAAKESGDDVLTKQDSNTEAESSQEPPPPVLKTTPVTEDPSTAPASSARHVQTSPPPALAGLGCTEEAGLEHTERVREDGVREVIYANGNRKEIHPSGKVTISFYNGDRKEIHADRTVYVYGSDYTSHTTYSSGKEEFVFPNGQRETRCPDGSSEIYFLNGSRKSVLSDGTEICTTRDGSVVRTNPDGSQVFEFPSGQREVHRSGEKRREYPDGTVKILHPDGRAETRYSSGRTRIKDREGNVVLDTHTALSSPLSS